MSSAPAEDDAGFLEARAKFRFVIHHGLGGVYRLRSMAAIARVRELLALTSARWITESLDCSRTWDGAWRLGARFQPLYSDDFLEHYARHVSMLMQELPATLAIENVPSYLPASPARGESAVRRRQMHEGAFLRCLTERTGCSLSLNVPAAYLSAQMCGIEPLAYLREFPLDRVIEMQLGVAGDLAGPDLPAGPDADQVLQLARSLWEHTPRLKAVFLESGPEPGSAGEAGCDEPEAEAVPHPGSTDLRIQDLLIRSVADSTFRHSAGNPGAAFFNPGDLDPVGRFFARRYYLRAVKRHYRYAGLLAPVTNRPPERVLAGDAVRPVLEAAVLGTRASAGAVARQVRAFLTEADEQIVGKIPYWKNLVSYEEAGFLAASTGARGAAGTNPRFNPETVMVDLDYDLEPVLERLTAETIPAAERRTITMLFCRDASGRVSTARATGYARRILKAADGTQSLDALARATGLSGARTAALAESLKKLGALV